MVNNTRPSVWDMNDKQFKEHLATLTTPDQLFENAPRIYDYLGELFEDELADSLLREWAFQWWASETDKDYNVIYDRWLGDE